MRVDTRKWLLSKLLPKKYGDRVEITGDAATPVITRIELVPVMPRAIDAMSPVIEHQPAAKSGGN